MENLEFQILRDIYREKEVEVEGEKSVVEYCVKKDAIVRWHCSDSKDITDVREVVNLRGKPAEDRCAVYSNRHESWHVVKGSYSEITEKLSNTGRIQPGFKQK